ncbi:LacI family DNA-binding transcriptional regulator [[Clostridium] polysaccharolyticum]|uniref:Transcriptional regulator, LacI family n=1 Tax=[Clostridium] polysaccharolyticum TaxID=29364 RepID=A0A1I0BU85_9FIRM|nr:LacI family DNA-binding transcriptional regulator [[Clostridium] polysaccharolyticum]SET10504.1 transcriptional regulator, LacI family [[Clostridium] polysaccharolyticum]
MATIKDLSMKCGVSVSTVSKALNGYHDISEQTRALVLRHASEMGYFPDANARALKMKKTCNIGVLYMDSSRQSLRNEYFAHILASFKEKVSRRGYDITFIEHNIGNRKMSYLEHCKQRNFDGICIACVTEFNDPEILELVNSDIPVVVIDHVFNGAISILSDNINGMRELIQYIINQGHKDIAYIHGTKSSVTHNRLVSFYNIMNENGLEVNEDFILEGEYRNVSKTEEITDKLLNLSKKPTCIIAPDDYSALGVMNVAGRRGIKIPQELSVAGFDGILFTKVLEPNLTTVRQDVDAIGAEAAKQLINLIESPMTTSLESICLQTQLIEGGTVKKL